MGEYKFEVKGQGLKKFFTQKEIGGICLYEKLGLMRDRKVGPIPKNTPFEVKKLVEREYGEVK